MDKKYNPPIKGGHMKRNWDLIREILKRVEDAEVGKQVTINSMKLEDYSIDVVQYHIELLCDKGLVKGIRGMDPRRVAAITRLTFDGHEFLDRINNDTIWNKTKAFIKDKGIALSFDLIGAIAAQMITKTLKL